MTNRPTAAIVTSRLPRLVPTDDSWIAGVRGVLRRIKRQQVDLIVGDGTAGTELIQHAAERLSLGCQIAAAGPECDRCDDEVPSRDRALVMGADAVYVLRLRSNGNLHQLLKQRLEQRGGVVIIIDLPTLQSEEVRDELCDLGAELWRPSDSDSCPLEIVTSMPCHRDTIPKSPPEGIYVIHPYPLDSKNWLIHTTRACPGPWPDQSFAEYADSLFAADFQADHTGLGTLLRILRQKQLIASGRTIRGNTPVVSFTARSISSLPELHCYRPHRIHWDFEPFGICLRRDWLLAQGVCPVNYGTNESWNTLAASRRPYFQLATGDSGIDWSIEQEWRHLGNLDLSQLTPELVRIFVPNFENATAVSAVTDLPVTLCPLSTPASSPELIGELKIRERDEMRF